MRILITGICGFAGSRIAELLQERSGSKAWSIVGLDNFSRPGSWLNRQRLIDRGIDVRYGDIRSSADVFSVGEVDWIVDAAANPSVLGGLEGESASKTLCDNNLLSTIHLLELAKRFQSGFILLSTSRVYSIDAMASLPLIERPDRFELDGTTPLRKGVSEKGLDESFSTDAPRSLYGSTKLASEVMALEYGEAFDFPVWINRCGVLAGAGQFGRADQGIFAYWLHSWLEKKPLRYLGFGGRGLQVRDCLHPSDLVDLLCLQIGHPRDRVKPRTIHVSGGIDSSRSLAQLSQWCRDRWGPHSVFVDGSPRTYDIPWLVLDSSLAETVWHWKPTTESILDEIADFAENHPDWLRQST